MTPNEINIQIAEFMGISKELLDDYKEYLRLIETEGYKNGQLSFETMRVSYLVIKHTAPGRGLGEFVPNYCEDIKAAFEVVEKLKHLCFRLDNVGFEGERWRVDFGWGDDPISVDAEADTPAMAISLAALASIGVKNA